MPELSATIYLRSSATASDVRRNAPDGKWIAYTSNNSRRVFDVYVESVPATGAIWQVSDGGFQPRWSSDGRELFYIRYDDAKLMAVPVKSSATLSFGAPLELFRFQPGAPDVGTVLPGTANAS